MADNINEIKEEFISVKHEFHKREGEGVKSIEFNIEGAKRSIAMFKDHLMGGVGTDGYDGQSEKYSTANNLRLPDRWARSHYFQKLAEEGVGAIIYFIFLVIFFCTVIILAIKEESDYVSLISLSLLASLSVCFLHGTISYVLENHSFRMIIYFMMGGCLGVLSSASRKNSKNGVKLSLR